jgi:hypothetical protein
VLSHANPELPERESLPRTRERESLQRMDLLPREALWLISEFVHSPTLSRLRQIGSGGKLTPRSDLGHWPTSALSGVREPHLSEPEWRRAIALTRRREHPLWIRDEFLLHEEHFGNVVVRGRTPVTMPAAGANSITSTLGEGNRHSSVRKAAKLH